MQRVKWQGNFARLSLPTFHLPLATVLLVGSTLLWGGCAFIIKNQSPTQPAVRQPLGEPIPAVIELRELPGRALAIARGGPGHGACADAVAEFARHLQANGVFSEVLVEPQAGREPDLILEAHVDCNVQEPPHPTILGSLIMVAEFLVPMILPVYDYDWRVGASLAVRRGDQLLKQYEVISQFHAKASFFGRSDRQKPHEGVERTKTYAYGLLMDALRVDRALFSRR